MMAPLSRTEYAEELRGLIDSLDDHVTAAMAAEYVHELAEALDNTSPEIWESDDSMRDA